MTLQAIARQLQEARKAKGYSQRKLAELTGIPQNHISRIENGQVDIRLSSLLELADVLGMEFGLHAKSSDVEKEEPSRIGMRKLDRYYEASALRQEAKKIRQSTIFDFDSDISGLSNPRFLFDEE